MALVAGAVLSLAVWLRTMAVPWLAVASLLTAIALLGSVRGRASRWGIAGLAVLALVEVAVGAQQRRLALIATQWELYARQTATAGLEALEQAVHAELAQLQEVAQRALDAPREQAGAFAHLRSLSAGAPGHRGVALVAGGTAHAWGGDLRATVEEMTAPVGVVHAPFYVVLYATVERGDTRGVATAVVHAAPPADRFTRALDGTFREGAELRGFAYTTPPGADSGWTVLSANGAPLVAVRPQLLSPGEAQVRVVERARLVGAAGLVVALLMLMGLMWRRPSGLRERLAVLALVAAVIGIVPLNAYSNASVVFDPGAYFVSFGGPYTASVAALALTSAVALLAFFALARAGLRLPSRWPAVAAVLVVASLGPFLLRDLSRGIALPGRGASTTLWLAWEVALFLAAAALLLAGASAGRQALGAARGLPPSLAPTLAAVGAILAPVLWQAPGRWPGWYPAVWIAAMASLALARRTRTLVLTVAVVAACGATTLVWGAVSRGRVELAQADVARLESPDGTTLDLMDRFASELEAGRAPVEREELLARFVRSPLAATGSPVEIASWPPGEDGPHAELRVADFERRPEGERALVAEARATGARVWRTEPSPQGMQTLLAVPHADGGITTMVVAPRTLLIPEDPFTLLLGLEGPAPAEVPYDLALTTLPSTSEVTAEPRWVRKGNEVHGDWLVPGALDAARVHVEVDLRGLDALVPRGALIVLLDLMGLAALWTLAAAGDGALARWGRQRLRRWRRSYRGRLSVTLFAFFVVPAGLFAFWSYRRILQTDQESRVLLVHETLRTVSAADAGAPLEALGARYDTPLFSYRGGRLVAASDSLYLPLAPVGRYLPASVSIGLGAESEVREHTRLVVAGMPMLFGYRSEGVTAGRRVVLAAPARMTERVLDRQRRDIGFLVLFATSLGALAAMGLSGLAARELERPVGALRRAALQIGRGEHRGEVLDEPPAVEFVPVFSAFERMDRDLAASRAALEEARRRTEAVLRNVASGVVAIGADGRVMIANPAADALLGRSVTPGATLADLGAAELHQRAAAFLYGPDDESEFETQIGDRQVRGNLTRLERGASGAVLTLDDVTELARAQRILAWGEMARQVAHEIKNPLTPIRLGVQHLRRARGDARVDFERVFEQNVTRILEEIDRLDEIARAFSRYGVAPSEQAPPEPVDVAAVVRDVVELERLGESGVTWHLRGAQTPLPALAREGELREVLLNLLENARQAHARNVTVDLARRDGRVQLVVQDDGDGIPAEALPRVFEPQFSTRTSGSGLGLAISRGLVAAWGGAMDVRSERGRGTEFCITLAAAPDA